MSRPKPVLALCAILLAVAVGGCGGAATPTPTLISDPVEIVTRGASSLQNVQTVHIEAKLGGSLDAAGLGRLSGGSFGGLSGALKLDNSSLSGDVDIANRAGHLTATVPNLFGLTLDYILIDGYLYGKSSVGGDKYTKTKLSTVLPAAAGLDPSALFDFGGAVATLRTAMDQAGVTATFAGLDKVAGRDSYHITAVVPNDWLNNTIGSAGGTAASGLTVDSLSIDYWAYADTLQPARIELKASSSALGHLDLTVTFTKYDQPVTVTAPPEDEVQVG